jgi:hypothetical protein
MKSSHAAASFQDMAMEDKKCDQQISKICFDFMPSLLRLIGHKTRPQLLYITCYLKKPMNKIVMDRASPSMALQKSPFRRDNGLHFPLVAVSTSL